MQSIFRQLARVEQGIRKRLNADADSYSLYKAQSRGYPADIPGYVRDVLGRFLTPQQADICHLLTQPPYCILVPSANTQGKTFLGASVASWFYDTYDPSICLLTAPTKSSVRDLLFRELRTIRPPNDFAPANTRLQSSPQHFIHGLTAQKADAFHGRHEKNLMIGFDEGTGIEQEFYRRAQTMFGRHEGHYWFVLYNPIDPSTYPYELEESGQFHVYRLNALEHCNLTYQLAGLDPLIPSAIRLETLLARINNKLECVPVEESEVNELTDFRFPSEELLSGYNGIWRSSDSSDNDFFSGVRSWLDSPESRRISGERFGLNINQWYRPISPWFEAQILGRWPMIGTENIFSPGMVHQCYLNQIPLDDSWQLQIGGDIARFGIDFSCLAVRRGPCLLHLEKHSRRDTTFIADRAYELAKQFVLPGELTQQVRFVVDGTGGYGGGVIDQARGRLDTVEVHFSSQSPDPKVLRMRSYLWFRLQSYAIANLFDISRLDPVSYKQLRDDLIAVRYRMDNQDRKVLETKEQVKARIKRSPDVADAVALCYYTDT